MSGASPALQQVGGAVWVTMAMKPRKKSASIVKVSGNPDVSSLAINPASRSGPWVFHQRHLCSSCLFWFLWIFCCCFFVFLVTVSEHPIFISSRQISPIAFHLILDGCRIWAIACRIRISAFKEVETQKLGLCLWLIPLHRKALFGASPLLEQITLTTRSGCRVGSAGVNRQMECRQENTVNGWMPSSLRVSGGKWSAVASTAYFLSPSHALQSTHWIVDWLYQLYS